MKKAIFAMAVIFSLISCGGSAEQVTSDSTSVDSLFVADSAVVGMDTTVAKIDSAK
jgi:uncharacterized lipoprotein NlpE involved in copper resistance